MADDRSCDLNQLLVGYSIDEIMSSLQTHPDFLKVISANATATAATASMTSHADVVQTSFFPTPFVACQQPPSALTDDANDNEDDGEFAGGVMPASRRSSRPKGEIEG